MGVFLRQLHLSHIGSPKDGPMHRLFVICFLESTTFTSLKVHCSHKSITLLRAFNIYQFIRFYFVSLLKIHMSEKINYFTHSLINYKIILYFVSLMKVHCSEKINYSAHGFIKHLKPQHFDSINWKSQSKI